MKTRWLIALSFALASGTAVAADEADFRALGSAACARCHTRALPEDEQPDGDGRKRIDFVSLDEFAVWKERDPHARAGSALQGELARQMGERLQVDVTAAAAGCIQCHAPFAAAEQAKPKDLTLTLTEGVSCEVCHGNSSEWLGPHFTRPDWRTLPAAEKSALGFRDVRSTIDAARLCAACHIGDAAAGKVVTHDMYAAGHPPIPSFELWTLSRRMPVHWRALEDKPEWVREQLGYREDESHKVKQVALGSLVSLEETLELLASRAEAAGTSGWPDFAQFECYACHHELQRGSWRQARAQTAQPGRPMYRSWSETLPQMVLVAAERNAETWQEPLGGIAAALSDRPFGEPAKLAVAARTMSRIVQNDLQSLADDERWTAAFGEKLLDEILRQAGERHFDFDAARQLGWSVQVLSDTDKSAPTLEELAELLVLGDDRPRTGPDAARSLSISATYDAEAARQLFEKLRAARGR